MKCFKHLFIPNGILFAIIGLIPVFFPLHQELWAYAQFYPYLFYVVAAALCWGFHKDRYFFVVICIGAAERAVYYLLAGAEGGIQANTLLYSVIGILLPVNLVIFELIKDRGVFTFWGILRWILVIVEICFLGLVYLKPGIPFTAGLENYLRGVDSFFHPVIPDFVTAVFLFALFFLLVRFLFRQVPFESSSIWALILLFMGFHYTGELSLAAYYASFTALLYIAAIVETSYRLAYYDELTELPARRALNDQLMRLGNKYTIAMADIDHFKKFNDRYGHDVGDQVLKMVAAKLKTVSGGGKPFRYGGEEFAIVFSGSDLEQAKPFLESLRKTIETTKFTIRGFGRAFKKKTSQKKIKQSRKSVKITLSIGLAEKTEKHPDASAVIKAADKALYRAKRSGRNRVSA